LNRCGRGADSLQARKRPGPVGCPPEPGPLRECYLQDPALNPGCGLPCLPGTHCLSPGPGGSADAGDATAAPPNTRSVLAKIVSDFRITHPSCGGTVGVGPHDTSITPFCSAINPTLLISQLIGQRFVPN
jgi:hypothetical protein